MPLTLLDDTFCPRCGCVDWRSVEGAFWCAHCHHDRPGQGEGHTAYQIIQMLPPLVETLRVIEPQQLTFAQAA